jgi:hypothetical protein
MRDDVVSKCRPSVEFEVFWTIVVFVAVPMVDDLVFPQGPTDPFSHDKAVFQHVALGIGHTVEWMVRFEQHSHVPFIGNATSTFPQLGSGARVPTRHAQTGKLVC